MKTVNKYDILHNKLCYKLILFLVYVDNHYIKKEIARQGYKLDILINDPEPMIRWEVARQGYGLDILINDKNAFVKELARRKQNEIHRSCK